MATANLNIYKYTALLVMSCGLALSLMGCESENEKNRELVKTEEGRKIYCSKVPEKEKASNPICGNKTVKW